MNLQTALTAVWMLVSALGVVSQGWLFYLAESALLNAKRQERPHVRRITANHRFTASTRIVVFTAGLALGVGALTHRVDGIEVSVVLILCFAAFVVNGCSELITRHRLLADVQAELTVNGHSHGGTP